MNAILYWLMLSKRLFQAFSIIKFDKQHFPLAYYQLSSSCLSNLLTAMVGLQVCCLLAFCPGIIPTNIFSKLTLKQMYENQQQEFT